MISNKVFISKTFQANELAALRQMRMNRNQLKLRKDHFVNFMVLTGIKNREIQGRDGLISMEQRLQVLFVLYTLSHLSCSTSLWGLDSRLANI